MRCLALAEEMAEAGWRIVFATGSETLGTVPALASSGYATDILPNAANDADVLAGRFEGGADVLVVDHYGRDVSFERECRAWARHILVFDDATGRDHDCDLLLDAAADQPTCYRNHIPAHARVLCGPAFATIRRSFLDRRSAALARRDGRLVDNILLSFGATDPSNATCRVIDILADAVGDAVMTVVLSSRAPHIGEVRRRANGKIMLVPDVTDMSDLMAQADLAIGAAGASAFERAALGLPSILMTLAVNQRGVCRTLAAAGAAVDGGSLDADVGGRLRLFVERLMNDANARTAMSKAASALVDGRGTRRVLTALAGDVAARGGVRIRLRLGSLGDETWLLELQQAPGTRRHFRNPAAPNADEHRSWMRSTLDDADALLLIVEADGDSAGMLRLDRAPDHGGATRYRISIAVDPAQYNRGVGSAALSLVRRLLPCAVLDADIMPENANSKRLFTAAGFRPAGDHLYRSEPPSAAAATSGLATARSVSWDL